MKKKIIIIVIVVVIAVAALYFFVIAPPPKEPQLSYYTPGDYFVTNIKDSTRLLKATIVLEISTENPDESSEYLTGINHVLRDIIIFTLRDKTEEELRSDTVQETLSAELVKNLNEGLGIDYIQKVYFNDYVIQ